MTAAKKKAKPKPVLIAQGAWTFTTPGTKTVGVRLTASGVRMLKHSKHVTLTAKGTFKPKGRTAESTERRFTLH